jgi:hypothetical protein
MSYIVPSVLVSQALANAGGVANATPNLEACIIGPAYNILAYTPGSLTSQIATAAYSSVSTTGSMALTAYTVTVVSSAGFNNGDSVLVIGAGASGANLQAIITIISGNVITLSSQALTAVTNAQITKAGSITNSAVDNTFTLPSQVAGQVVTTSSIAAWFGTALVETLTSGFTVTPGSNSVVDVTATGTTTAGGTTTDVIMSATPTNFQIGDTITIATVTFVGGGTTTKITNKVGTDLTISPAATASVATGLAVAKVMPINLNSTTNTLRAEPGDKVIFSYIDSAVTSYTLSTTIQTVVTSSGLNGSITNFTLTDSLPSTTLTGTVAAQTIRLSVQKTYIDQLVLNVNPITTVTQVDTTLTGTAGTVTIKTGVSLIYGPIISATVYLGYKALRTDLSGSVLTINNAKDLSGQLGVISQDNPLGLAVQIALSNTTGRIRAIAVSSNDLAGHTAALTTAEGERIYFLTPLTQDQSIIAAYKAHCLQMSTPVNASWRVTLANTAIPLTQSIGPYTVSSPNPTAVTTLVGGSYVLFVSNATFISDGVIPGDVIYFTAASVSGQVGAHQVVSVIDNQHLVVNTTATATAISYYITRSMSKTQMATSVAAVSTQFNTSRVIHVQPDLVGVSIKGVTQFLPGYYLCASLAGMGAGFAVQQGFTNVGVAGVVDLQHSNFYFSKADLNTMAGAGTCVFVQQTQGGNPYCRHELTTDMTTLVSRELLMVKEMDYLSYFYYDILKSFLGSWNVTPSSLNTVRQTIVAGSSLLMSQSLPKIGPVLLGYTIATLAQDKVNTDTINCVVNVAIGTPLNYVVLTLVV